MDRLWEIERRYESVNFLEANAKLSRSNGEVSEAISKAQERISDLQSRDASPETLGEIVDLFCQNASNNMMLGDHSKAEEVITQAEKWLENINRHADTATFLEKKATLLSAKCRIIRRTKKKKDDFILFLEELERMDEIIKNVDKDAWGIINNAISLLYTSIYKSENRNNVDLRNDWLSKAELYIERAVQNFLNARAEKNINLCYSLIDRARIFQIKSRNNYQEREKYLQKSHDDIEIVLQLLSIYKEIDFLFYCSAKILLGNISFDQGRYKASIDAYSHVINDLRSYDGSKTRRYYMTLQDCLEGRINSYLREVNLDLALRDTSSLIEIKPKAFMKVDARITKSSILRQQRRIDEAIEELTDIQKSVGNEGSYIKDKSNMRLICDLASLYRKVGKLDRSEEILVEGLKTFGASNLDQDFTDDAIRMYIPGIYSLYQDLYGLYRRKCRYNEAQEILEKIEKLASIDRNNWSHLKGLEAVRNSAALNRERFEVEQEPNFLSRADRDIRNAFEVLESGVLADHEYNRIWTDICLAALPIKAHLGIYDEFLNLKNYVEEKLKNKNKENSNNLDNVKYINTYCASLIKFAECKELALKEINSGVDIIDKITSEKREGKIFSIRKQKAMLLNTKALILNELGRYDDGQSNAEQSREIFIAIDDDEGEIFANIRLASALIGNGNITRAEICLKSAEELAIRGGFNRYLYEIRVEKARIK